MNYFTEADTPEYTAAMRKSIAVRPEVFALAARLLPDDIMASMQEAGIKKDITLTNLAIQKGKLDVLKEISAADLPAQRNELLRMHYGTQNMLEREKLDDKYALKTGLGLAGLGISGYSAWKKMQLAERLGPDALATYLGKS